MLVVSQRRRASFGDVGMWGREFALARHMDEGSVGQGLMQRHGWIPHVSSWEEYDFLFHFDVIGHYI